MNEQITSIVAAFAKANRVNRAKLMELVESVLPAKRELKYVKSEVATLEVLAIAERQNGVVTMVDIRANGIKSGDYVANMLVKAGKLVKVEATKNPGRGRPTVTYKLVEAV